MSFRSISHAASRCRPLEQATKEDTGSLEPSLWSNHNDNQEPGSYRGPPRTLNRLSSSDTLRSMGLYARFSFDYVSIVQQSDRDSVHNGRQFTHQQRPASLLDPALTRCKFPGPLSWNWLTLTLVVES